MGFDVAAEGYDRFIGRYSRALAPRFADFAGVTAGPALDVGCGPGALAAALAARLGGGAEVAAVDPSERFVEACRARVPGADVRRAPGEALPFADATFTAALAQLVIAFVSDADEVAREMARVVRPGGAVAFCMFAHDGFDLVGTYWRAARRFDRRAPDDARLPFRRVEELAALCERAGLGEVTTGELPLEAAYSGFDDLWEPFAFGIGPTGGHLLAQSPARRDELRDACFELLGRPAGPFVLKARVIAARGRR